MSLLRSPSVLLIFLLVPTIAVATPAITVMNRPGIVGGSIT